MTYINVSLIKYSGKTNATLADILNSLNGYLLRNKGAVSDFNLVKDIVDRNVDKLDDEISNSIPTPLYLGLMGTMLGIVFGLVLMPSLSSGNTESANAIGGIDSLLNGVKIAMIASVVGLLLTVINNFLFFRARKKVENQKHDFFTFVQTQLLPILSKNTSSSIYSLQANLLQFNQEFSSNMRQFQSTVGSVKETFDSQLEVVQELKRIDVANIAKYNIDVMQQLEKSFKKLKDLSKYLDGMESFINNTQQLNFAVNQQLKKVGSISEIVKCFNSNAEIISENSRYLKSHFEMVDRREQAINDRLADFDGNTNKMVDDLQQSFSERLQKFNEKDVEINSGFEQLFQDLREHTKEVFDDESGTIAHLRNEVEGIKNNTVAISKLADKTESQDATIRELLQIIKEKPIEMKQSKWVNYTTVAVSVMVTGLSFAMLYRVIFID